MDFSFFDFVNFTSYIDLTQVLLYAFWLFFGYLVFYLQKEGRREGYPLESDETGGIYNHGVIYMPDAKTFVLPNGHGEYSVPDYKREERALALEASEPWSGAPKDPTGSNPMLDGVGPGAYAERAEVPDTMWSGAVKIRPMKKLDNYAIPSGDPNPIDGPVRGCDGEIGGTVVDVWIDQAESVIRYYEVQVSADKKVRTVLLPANFVVPRSKPDQHLYVHAITGAQFAQVPLTAAKDQITLAEEDKIMGYYGAGFFYAVPRRTDPLL
ncbi:MAG: photosynthetic reaction center subunit H [Pseudomonadota bacterium]